MWRRARIWGTAMVVAGGAIGAAGASAQSEAPRQTYSERFTTDEPGAPTGRAYAIDWVNPSDRDGKPPSFSHLRVELAEGARFDTSAIPQCRASDAELIAAGTSACPRDSLVANDETLLDTGFPGPGRYVTSDLVFFNNRNELVLLATIRENGARAVLRAQVGVNTIDLDVPPLPGTPPDGGAAKRQRGTFYPRSTRRDGRQLNYLTTPPACPSSGYWVNKVTYTYRDGIKQTAQSRSPCRPSAPPGPPKCAGRTATIVGTAAADQLKGTSRRDVIVSLGGRDSIRAGGGSDIVCAGSGGDRVSGGSGNDRLYGQRGRDRLAGGSGNDRLSGGSGSDRLGGGNGNDRLSGGSRNDRLFGGRGRDRLLGGSGRDRLLGGPGRDLLVGGPGRDRQRQ